MSKEHAHCCVCKEKYNKNELYSCCNEHTFCSHCYKTEYYKTNERKCPRKHCYSWVKRSPPVVCKCDLKKPKKMFPRPQSVAEKKKVSAQDSIISIYRGKSTYTQLLSRKPVNCPHFGCNKWVAVSSFDAHFSYEHTKVQVIPAQLEVRNGMELYLNPVGYNNKRCIARLDILENGDAEGHLLHYETGQGEIIKPSLILLAAQLPSTYEEQTQFRYSSDDTTSEHSDSQTAFAFNAGDKLFIWLASNIQVDLSYTVAISTTCNRVMMKYFGPLVTLDAEPKNLYMEGKGLALSEHQLMGMTNNLQNTVILNVLVHGKD